LDEGILNADLTAWIFPFDVPPPFETLCRMTANGEENPGLGIHVAFAPSTPSANVSAVILGWGGIMPGSGAFFADDTPTPIWRRCRERALLQAEIKALEKDILDLLKEVVV